MKLLHFALLSEAQYFIEKLKLKKISSNPKIYKNENYLALISGVGKENSQKALEDIFGNFEFEKAFNIGIAGCSSKEVKIGSLVCPTHKLEDILNLKLITSNQPTILNSPHLIAKFRYATPQFSSLRCKVPLRYTSILLTSLQSSSALHLNSQFLPLNPIIFDMEGKYFIKITKKYIEEKNIYIFKVVSDYLDDIILPKEFVKNLFINNYKIIRKYLDD